MSPLLAALVVDDLEMRLLVWYIGECLVLAGVLGVLMLRERRAPMRLALLAGIALQVAAAGCGVFTDSGACDDSRAGLPGVAILFLVGVGVVAEVVAKMERRRWQHAKNAQG